MAMQTFLDSGINWLSNQIKKRLDENFAELNGRLDQLLHGGVYQLTSDATTVVSIQGGHYTATGALSAVGNNYGFTPHETLFRVDHAHVEPTGTTHYYDIDVRGHIVVQGAATITGEVKWFHASDSSTDIIWTGTAELIKTPGTGYHTWFNARTRAALENGDFVWITLANETGTEDIVLSAGAAISIRGT